MGNAPGKRRDNGLYLSKFETKEEALEYIDMLSRKYLYAPDPKKVSLRKLCRYAKREGVIIHVNSLSNWFKDMGIEIKNNRPKNKRRYVENYSIDKEVLNYLQDYSNKSYMVELGLRILMRLPTEDLVIFLPSEDKEDPINVVFQKKENKIKAIATGKLNQRDKSIISGLIKKAENLQSMQPIIDYANLFGFKHFGGNIEETNDKRKK